MRERDLNSKIAIVINSNGMGDAPQELSHTLIKNYLNLLLTENRVPAYICIYANGVVLACEGSHILEELKRVETAGAKIVICKTCLVFNSLLDRVAVGSVGTMLDILDIQHNSTKVITL